MNKVKSIKKLAGTKYLNLYEFMRENRNGKIAPYYVASRTGEVEKLKACSDLYRIDAVEIYGIVPGRTHAEDRIVLVRQFRPPIDNYIYELPAGLIDGDESLEEAACREIYEETGLSIELVEPEEGYDRPLFAGIGMCDESIATVYGYCSGDPTNIHQEDSEDIEVVLADRAECARILREETVALMCGYQMMHFIHTPGDPLAFAKKRGGNKTASGAEES